MSDAKLLNAINKNKSVLEMADESLPSDENLQDKKKKRREAADNITQSLAEKGWPTVGAVAGAVTDFTADLIPESREQYKEDMLGGMGGMAGTTKKVLGKVGMPEAKATMSSIGESLRKKLVGSADEMDAFNKDPNAWVAAQEAAAKESRAAAQKVLDLKEKIGISKNAKPADEALKFEGTQANEVRRMADPSKVFKTIEKVADVESGAIQKPALAEAINSAPVVKEVKWPKFDGESHQAYLKRIREEMAKE